ncbi:site-specific DNA-methyltransferase [Actinokineospora sp. UTMC 2448]|uniref:site-specific DNA-methyltransferase n=1 Tax=Actinokineospora sp. UTMC 2448 TaxID=2268449 RepID=UPI0021649BB4|nr:site-specific DNA-methyltransferase [Actinokineospora sp. UTMC 2448]UVS77326.1 Adenine specific DNA methylase Mod [Actinokineospora sp. UTMC 2448]
MDKLKMHSPDLTQRNIDAIAELFPTVVTETLDSSGKPVRAVDFDLLRQELSDHIVEGPQERYQLDWPGKRAAAFAANTPIAKTLRPVREESVDFDTTKNIFIEGDNLEALKLLQESLLGRVDAIYIDPPYNSGADWVYNDDFVETTSGYLSRSGQHDSAGGRLIANTEANGRFHSDWLSMMYPRLKLARNLLSDSGVLIVAIDDGEHSGLKQILDQVFGAQNFLSNVVWQGRAKNDARFSAGGLDYMLVYARNRNRLIADDVRWKEPKSGYGLVVSAVRDAWATSGHDAERATALLREWWRTKPDTEKGLQSYTEIDEDGRAFLRGPLASPNPRANLQYDLAHPVTGKPVPMHPNGWRYSKETMKQMISDGRIIFGPDENTAPRRKVFLDEQEDQAIRSLVVHERASATSAVASLMGAVVFDNPKDTGVLGKWINAVTGAKPDAVVLDFFGGSGATGHAVMELNRVDGGQRRFVIVQLDEPVAAESVARQEGYETIAQIARERLRRAGTKLRAEAGLMGDTLDVGFRALRVDSTSMADTLSTADELVQPTLSDVVGSVKPDRTDEDVLFQVLLDWGLDLSEPITVQEIAGQDVFTVANDALIACFSNTVNDAVVRAIAVRHPLRAVFLDAGFASDAARINAEQVFREVSPETEVRAI